MHLSHPLKLSLAYRLKMPVWLLAGIWLYKAGKLFNWYAEPRVCHAERLKDFFLQEVTEFHTADYFHKAANNISTGAVLPARTRFKFKRTLTEPYTGIYIRELFTFYYTVAEVCLRINYFFFCFRPIPRVYHAACHVEQVTYRHGDFAVHDERAALCCFKTGRFAGVVSVRHHNLHMSKRRNVFAYRIIKVNHAALKQHHECR